MTELPRTSALVALLVFAAVNALAWVAALRVLARVVPAAGSPLVLGMVAVLTGLAVPVAVGAVRLRTPAT